MDILDKKLLIQTQITVAVQNNTVQKCIKK